MIAGRRQGFIIAILDPDSKGKERDDQRDDKTRRPQKERERAEERQRRWGGWHREPDRGRSARTVFERQRGLSTGRCGGGREAEDWRRQRETHNSRYSIGSALGSLLRCCKESVETPPQRESGERNRNGWRLRVSVRSGKSVARCVDGEECGGGGG